MSVIVWPEDEKTKHVENERARILAHDPGAKIKKLVCKNKSDENGKPVFDEDIIRSGKVMPKGFDPRKR